MAAQEGFVDIVEYLLSRGADVSRTCKSGITPVEIYWFSLRLLDSVRTLMGVLKPPPPEVDPPLPPSWRGRSTPSVFSRGGSLLPASYADVRSPDDVIAF